MGRLSDRLARRYTRLGHKEARQKLLDIVNRKRYRREPYTMRQSQQAVCVARRRRLVSPRLLEAAGYNAHE